MEIIKRKILLENSRDKSYDSEKWGKLSADTFFINILLTQSIDDMGLFSDIDTSAKTKNGSVNYTVLTQYLDSLGVSHNFTIDGNIVINDVYVYLSKIYKLISKFRKNYKIILFDTIQEEQNSLLDENITLIKLNKCNCWRELLHQMIEHNFFY